MFDHLEAVINIWNLISPILPSFSEYRLNVGISKEKNAFFFLHWKALCSEIRFNNLFFLCIKFLSLYPDGWECYRGFLFCSQDFLHWNEQIYPLAKMMDIILIILHHYWYHYQKLMIAGLACVGDHLLLLRKESGFLLLLVEWHWNIKSMTL